MASQEKIAGGLLGLLVGDAVGVPYEFHPPSRIPPISKIELEPPVGFSRAHAGVPVGTWSDDGAHALALLDSLLTCGALDLDDLGVRLVRWYREGAYAVDSDVFDVGIQTTKAIHALEEGTAATESGPSGEYDNGNGALMRVLPLALWHRGSNAELAALAERQGIVTHGHLRSGVCCAVYCLWARFALQGHEDAAIAAMVEATALYSGRPEHLAELLCLQSLHQATGTGYVVDCLRSAIWANRADSYEEVIRRAICLGNDTDTTACVAGGIAGIRFGVSGIPERWLGALRGREIVDPLLATLLKGHADDAI